MPESFIIAQMRLKILKLGIGLGKLPEKLAISALVIDDQPRHRQARFDFAQQRKMIRIAGRIGQSHGGFPGLHRSLGIVNQCHHAIPVIEAIVNPTVKMLNQLRKDLGIGIELFARNPKGLGASAEQIGIGHRSKGIAQRQCYVGIALNDVCIV